METDARRAANEEAVRQFFSAWDPAWRWILILGMRQLREDPTALGKLASAEANGEQSWAEDAYAYGTLSQGITAAAVSEAAQHCEDLFALLRFLREETHFVREIANYGAGKVVEFGRKLQKLDTEAISRLFLVPDQKTVRAGLTEADDQDQSVRRVEAGRKRLAEMVRATVAFYLKIEDLHIQYKHGLKVRLKPFGPLSPERIAERKDDVNASLFSYTTEPISQMVRRPADQQAMMFFLGPAQQAHLTDLVSERNVLRLQLIHEIDLNEVVERSHVVLRLLRIAQDNRLAIGALEDGCERFSIPGEGAWESISVSIKVDHALSLSDFSEPPKTRRQRPS